MRSASPAAPNARRPSRPGTRTSWPSGCWSGRREVDRGAEPASRHRLVQPLAELGRGYTGLAVLALCAIRAGLRALTGCEWQKTPPDSLGVCWPTRTATSRSHPRRPHVPAVERISSTVGNHRADVLFGQHSGRSGRVPASGSSWWATRQLRAAGHPLYRPVPSPTSDCETDHLDGELRIEPLLVPFSNLIQQL